MYVSVLKVAMHTQYVGQIEGNPDWSIPSGNNEEGTRASNYKTLTLTFFQPIDGCMTLVPTDNEELVFAFSIRILAACSCAIWELD